LARQHVTWGDAIYVLMQRIEQREKLKAARRHMHCKQAKIQGCSASQALCMTPCEKPAILRVNSEGIFL